MPGGLAGRKVLLVDDDRDILAAMEAALSVLGVDILKAVNGNEAVTQADEHRPDVIVLDQMLPGRSGFLVMEKLKRDSRGAWKPRVIMITGNQGTRHRAYAESLGVDLYLNKPFRMERLTGAIEEMLGPAADAPDG